MRRSFSSAVFGLILLSTVLLPPFAFTAFNTSSMAAGAFVVSGLYVFAFVVLSADTLRRSPTLGSGAILLVAVLGVVITQGAISFPINHDFDFRRFSQSYLLLIVYLLGAFSFALLTQRVPEFHTDVALKLVFYVLLLSSVAGILHFSPFSEGYRKPVVFFFRAIAVRIEFSAFSPLHDGNH